MLVEEPGYLRIKASSDGERLTVMLSDEIAERYLEVRRTLDGLGVLDLTPDDEFLPQVISQLLVFLSVDLEMVEVSASLIALVVRLWEKYKRVVVCGYTVTMTPAIVGKARVGETRSARKSTKLNQQILSETNQSVTDR